MVHKFITKRSIWLGCLSIIFSLNFHYVSAQKPPTEFYISIDKDKKSFLSKAEISIQDYHEMMWFVKEKFGNNSEEYKFLIPDTVAFKELYGFPFFYRKEGVRYRLAESKIADFICDLQGKFPMVAISYEQAVAYCKWMETSMNQQNNTSTARYTFQCSLPEKADYETAINHRKAKITQKPPLYFLRKNCKKYCRKTKDGSACLISCRYPAIFGLTDNVAEYIQDGMIVEGGTNTALKFVTAKECENPIGFRIKVVRISKK